MKILFINTNNSAGGASKACFRLHEHLLDLNIESNLLMLEQPNSNICNAYSYYEFYLNEQRKKFLNTSLFKKLNNKLLYQLGKGEEANFNKRRTTENKLLAQKPKHLEVFTFSSSLYNIQDHPLYQEADIIHLHWVSNNYLDYQSFFTNNTKPVVWTLHDMNPFTGGCHYSEGCKGYINNCSNCPQLQGTENPYYASKELGIKLKALEKYNKLIIASPSTWLLDRSCESKLFSRYPHIHVPYGIDSNIFQTRDKYFSRKLLNIPVNKKVILFVAHNIHSIRKGYDYLLKSLQMLDFKDEVALCAIGMKNYQISNNKIFYELGSISDERMMSAAYSAADVFVIPSLEDNLPNTVIESLLCGTPVIGFPTGGIIEMIQDGENGYLCEEISVAALSNKINKFLANPFAFNPDEIRNAAVEKYDSSVQAKRYIKVYQQLLQS